MSYHTKNYTAPGGNETVIGGKLTFLDPMFRYWLQFILFHKESTNNFTNDKTDN